MAIYDTILGGNQIKTALRILRVKFKDRLVGNYFSKGKLISISF